MKQTAVDFLVEQLFELCKIIVDIDDAWDRGWVQACSDYRVKNK